MWVSCCGTLLDLPTYQLVISGDQSTVAPRKTLCSQCVSHQRHFCTFFFFLIYCKEDFFSVSIPKTNPYFSYFRQRLTFLYEYFLITTTHCYTSHDRRKMSTLILKKKKRFVRFQLAFQSCVRMYQSSMLIFLKNCISIHLPRQPVA